MAAAAYRIAEVDPLGADALKLLRQAAIEARALYPELHVPGSPWPTNAPTPARGTYLVAYLADEPVAMGAHRPIDNQCTEVRRMFVARPARRCGAGRAILQALEIHAQSQGFDQLLLETGFKQLAAMALYESYGFVRIPPFGPYATDPTSVCFSKPVHGSSAA
ncbi:GNAT family N-acetyltransferase [Aquabacterium sp.]|uniref:GNAT family N-acetyltransferase n=1 Tax=Aquabacterium sp. TaxID=1872578 RepID=UPI00378505C3